MKMTNPLEVICSDLACPIDPIGKDGFKYVISFIDILVEHFVIA